MTSGSSTGTFGGVTDNLNGTYTGSFSGLVAGTPATISASVGGTPVSSALPTITVTPGPAIASQSIIQVSSTTVQSGAQVTLTLVAKDAVGNFANSGGRTVLFARSGGTSTGTIGSTTDQGNGSYTAAFTGSISGTATTITATLDGSAITTTLPTVTVTPGAVSISQSVVSVSSASLASGSTINLTLQAKDAAANSLSIGGSTVVFSRSGGLSNGTISGTTDNGNGTYTAVFTGTTAGSATTINATVGGAAVTSTMPTVVVSPGSVSLAQSLIQVSSGTVGSGSTTTLTVVTKDAVGNSITSSGLTIAFGNSGGTSTGSIAATTDNLNGTYSAIFTGIISGSPTTISATIGGSPVTSTPPTVTVIPGAISAATSVVTVSSATIASNSNATLTLTAKDANSNLITGGSATILFSRSGGSSTGTISGTTDNSNGTYTAIFTGVVSGSATTINATIGGSPVTTTLPTITVTPGTISLANSAVTITGSPATLTSGSSVGLTLTARDVNNNQMTSGGRTIVFTSSSGGGISTVTFGSVSDNGNGTYSGTMTGVLAGTSVSIGATIDAASVTATAPSLSVTPGSFSASISTVAVASSNVNSGSATTVTVTIRDTAGNQLTTGGLSVTVGNTGGTSSGSFGSVTDNNNGTYSAQFTGAISGTATTITAAVGGTPISSTLPTINVNPGPVSATTTTLALSASTVAAGASVNVTIQAKDAAGNNRTSGGATVVLNTSAGGGESTGSFSAVIDNSNGTYSSTFTGDYAGTATTVTGTINGSTITTTLPTITVVPGAVSTAHSVINVSSTTLLSGSSITTTLIAKDARSNQLTTGGLTVAFNYAGGVSTGTFGSITDNNNGTYSSTFTGVLAGSATTLGATIGGSAITTTTPTITVNPGVIAYSQSSIALSAGTVVSASQITAVLSTRDAAGNVLGSGGRTVVFNYGSGNSTVTFGTVVDNSNGTYSVPVTGVVSGTATSISATINAVAIQSTAPTLQVLVGPISLATSVITVSSGSVPSGTTSTLTLQARDSNNNNLISGSETVVFSRSGGTSTGSIGATTIVGNGTYTAVFSAITIGTPTNISATVNGSPVTSKSPTITVVPGLVSTATSTIAASAASIDSGATSVITMTARDANGNQQSSGGLVVAMTRSGGTTTGTFSAVADNGNGTYTSTFTGVLSGTATNIGATIGGSATGSTVAVTVTPGPLSLSQSTVALQASTVASSSAINVTVVKRDSAGNQTTQGSNTVVLSRSGGTSTGSFSSVTNVGDGSFTATFTGAVAGTAATIGAQVGGSPISSTLPTITVTPGPIALARSLIQLTGSPTTLASGSTVSLTVTARDANDNTLATGGSTVVVSFSGGSSTGSFTTVNDNSNGTYSTTFTGLVSGSTSTFGATIDAAAITNTLPTLQVTPGAISAANSTVALSSSTIASGTTSTITVSARDANNNLIAPGGHTVSFSQNSGTSTGSISAVTDNTTGTYTATLTGVATGTSTTLGATINGLSVSSTLPTFLVTPGALSLSNSLLTVSATSATAGSNVNLTLTTKDAAGNQLTLGGSTVVFTRSGGVSNGTISGTTDPNSGVYTAVFAATTSGTATTIGATVNGTPITSTLPTITVNAGAFSLANSVVSASTATAAAGTVVNLLLTSRDSFDNDITSGSETVNFTKGTGTSDGTISATTNNGNGTYSATFTASTKGTARSIGALVGGSPITKLPLPTITVNPAALSLTSSLVAVSSSTIASGTATSITLTAKDDFNNVMNAGGLTVLFGMSGGTSTATFGTVADNGNGTYTASVTGLIAGTASTFSATIGGSSVSSTMPTLTVTPGAISIGTSVVTVGHAVRQAGASTTITLTARDAAGNLLGTGGSTVTFFKSSGSSAGTIGTVSDVGNGTYTASFSAITAGSAAVIGAQIGGLNVTTTSPTITVTAGPHSLADSTVTRNAATTSVGGTLTFTVTVKDAYANQQSVGGLTIAFGLSGGTANGTIAAVNDNGDGTYSAIFTGTVAGTNTTVTATINGSAITNTLPTISVDPPTPSPLNSIITVAAGSVASGSGTVVTLTTRDVNDLLIGAGGYTVVFNHSGGSSTGTFGTVTDVGDGTYTATFTGVVSGTATSIGANISGGTIVGSPAIVSTLPTITVVPGPVSQLLITGLYSQGLTGFALHMQPIVTLRDANNNVCTNDNASTVVISKAAGAGSILGTATLSKVAVNGIADYDGLGIGFDAVGTGYQLQAAIGGITAVSSLIDVIDDVITISSSPSDIRAVGNLPANIITPTLLSVNVAPLTESDAVLTNDLNSLYSAAQGSGQTVGVAGGTVPTGGSAAADLSASSNNFTITVARPSTIVSTCTSDAPYASIACTWPYHVSNTTSHQLTGARIASEYGQSPTYVVRDVYVPSNALATKRFLTEQITNFINPVGGPPPVGTDNIQNFTVVNGALYFTGNRVTNNVIKIFKLTHNSGHTPIIAQTAAVRALTTSDAIALLTVDPTEAVPTRLWYRANSNTGSNLKIHYLDTVTDTAYRVSNLAGALATSDLLTSFLPVSNPSTAVKNRIYVSAPNQTVGGNIGHIRFAEINNTTPTARTAQILYNTNLAPGTSDSTNSITYYNGNIYFASTVNSTNDRFKLFKFDPVGGAVTRISNIINNVASNEALANLIVFNGRLMFTGNMTGGGASNRNKILSYDGTTIRQVANTSVANNNQGDQPTQLTVVKVSGGEKLYFIGTANNTTTEQKLYSVDSSWNVTRVSNIVNGNNDNLQILGPWDINNDGLPEYLMIRVGLNAKLHAVDLATNEIIQVANILGDSNEDLPAASGGASYGGHFYFTAFVGSSTDNNTKMYRLKLERPVSLTTPDPFKSTISVSAGTVVTGNPITVTLTTRNINGTALTTGGYTVAFSHADGTSTGTFSALTDVGNGTYTATFTGGTVGTATVIRATITGAGITGSPNINSALPRVVVLP